MWVAGFSLFLLGLIIMIVAPINRRKNKRCSAQTQGTLLKILKRRNSNGPISDMYVYSYYVDGIEYKLKSTVRSPETHEAGDTGTIWYNPKKPKDAQTFRYSSDRVYKILFFIGIAMLLVGIILFVVGMGMS